MKIYKRSSFWKSQITGTLSFGFILFAFLVLPVIINHMPQLFRSANTIGIFASFIILIVMIAPFIIILLTQYYYVILYDNRLVIKSSVFKFIKTEFLYEAITKVIITNPGGLAENCLQVYTTQKKSKRYFITMISLDDYDSLLNDLKEKGIETENTARMI